jgi:hypothetical protein
VSSEVMKLHVQVHHRLLHNKDCAPTFVWHKALALLQGEVVMDKYSIVRTIILYRRGVRGAMRKCLFALAMCSAVNCAQFGEGTSIIFG